MALVVEDGTGLANAESYVSLADASAYAINHGLTFAIDGDDAALAEQALRRATTWMDATFRDQYPGFRTTYRFQALEWPRTGAIDNGAVPQPIGMNEIPTEIIKATIEAAVYEKANPSALTPVLIEGKIVQSVKAGSVSVDFSTSGIGGKRITGSDMIPTLTKVQNILGSLFQESAGLPVELLKT